VTPVVLRGRRVTLRPIRADELDVVYAGLLAHAGDTPFRPNRARLRRRIEQSGLLTRGRLMLGIDVDGRLVGDIAARQSPDALPPGVFDVGIDLFDPADRGRGYGTEAVALLTDHLFAELGAARVQGSTEVSNTAMRRVFERLGFVEEGVMRAFMPRADGARDDYVLYARTIDGPPDVRAV
jgi:ribosomal-protein-alanine N-acetyltransferase